ncbi:hypothetical protein Tco_1053683 [Tanacetum coccineum]|uniref:Uncharacterized protein n=1 Tax=Tanacetum coccineum TaxID=301880 RepID=A0ABQ5GUL0_9ASTR
MDLTAATKNRFMELNELMELRDGVYENTRVYKERTKRWHDSRLRWDKNFKVGDKVLPFNSRFKMHPGKLKSRWYGPNVEVDINKKTERLLEDKPIRRIHQRRYGVSVLALPKTTKETRSNTPYLGKDYEWYNELTDRNLKEEALKQKAIYEKSWGNASQSEMNFCAWLKRSFGNFHELDYELLIKLQDYWWKVNDHECSPFSYWMNYIQGPYANYYRNILDKEEHEDEDRCELFDDQERPVCNIKRFEMIKYSFRKDEEYVVVKENEYDDLTSTSKEVIHAYQEIFRMMDEGWMITHTE